MTSRDLWDGLFRGRRGEARGWWLGVVMNGKRCEKGQSPVVPGNRGVWKGAEWEGVKGVEEWAGTTHSSSQ